MQGGDYLKKKLALFLCFVLILSILSGCTGKGDTYTPTGNGLSPEEEDVTRPTQTVITTQDRSLPYYADRSMNPYTCSDYVNKTILSLVYQGLFTVDAQYNVFPVLCSGYEVSRDMKTYTFYLAKATFSDGMELTAADVVASYTAAMEAGVYKGRFTHVKSVEATEDGAVVFQLKVPYENFPILLDIPIVREGSTAEERPMGTGPYAYSGEQRLRLRRRIDWWCDAQLPIASEWIDLEKAENSVQIRDDFEVSGLGMVASDPGNDNYVDFHSDYELWDCENGLFLYLGCNSRSAVFSDAAVRQALTYAVDRNGIVEDFYRGFAYAAGVPASPKSPYYSDALASKIRYNPMELSSAVANANLQGSPVVMLVNSDDVTRVRVAREIAHVLSLCGLTVTMSELGGDDYRNALKNGKFDIYLGQTKLSANMDLSPFFATYGALSYGGMNDAVLYALCQESLANIGNYYTLHQKVLEDGQLCPVLFRSYAIFAQRGDYTDLSPARDRVFYYDLGITMEDILIEKENEA
jgi:peptide/nickel transport system substrate-binding protein